MATRYGKPGKWVFNAYGIALRYIDAGEDESAIDWLEKAFEEHDASMQYLGLPLYDPLRSNPRFQELPRKMNLPLDEKD